MLISLNQLLAAFGPASQVARFGSGNADQSCDAFAVGFPIDGAGLAEQLGGTDSHVEPLMGLGANSAQHLEMSIFLVSHNG